MGNPLRKASIGRYAVVSPFFTTHSLLFGDFLRSRFTVGPAQSTTILRAADDEKKAVLGSREEEPEEYWRSEAEAAGKSPFSDPMAWAALSAIVIPLLILVVGFATGFIETS